MQLRLLWSKKEKRIWLHCTRVTNCPGSSRTQELPKMRDFQKLKPGKSQTNLDELIGLVLVLKLDTKRKIHKREI